MGQMTYALLLGCEIPEGAELYTDECDGVMDAWRGIPGCPRGVVRWPDDTNLIGVVMAAGQSGVDDTANLDSFGPLALDAHDDPEIDGYAAAEEVAWQRWRAWSQWCSERGLTLPRPRVYLVRIEVA